MDASGLMQTSHHAYLINTINDISYWQKASKAKRSSYSREVLVHQLVQVDPEEIQNSFRRLGSASFMCSGGISDTHLWAGIPNRTSITLCSNQTLKADTQISADTLDMHRKRMLISPPSTKYEISNPETQNNESNNSIFN